MKNIFLTLLLLAGIFSQKLAAQPCQTMSFQNIGCDLSTNDAELWNAIEWWDATLQLHDLTEAPATVSITVVDNCGGAVGDLSYVLHLDLDGDGLRETRIESASLPPAGEVIFDNANGPGEARQFDQRPVPSNLKFQFALNQSPAGATRTASVAFSDGIATNIPPQIPTGNHRIQWFLDGNMIADEAFEVKDCKAPTLVCLNGLSANVMPTGMIQLWASDFLQYAEDNATPGNLIEIGIRKSGTGTGFPLDANGNALTSVVYSCLELGTNFIELWGRDKAGNTAYCETYIIVQDNANNCSGASSGGVTACAETAIGDGIEEVNFSLTGASPNLPPFSFFNLTQQTGCANFPNVPPGADITVTPVKDDNPLNGVTTFDLVLISKHILGLQPLNTPYKIIAADMNRSGSVTTFDIVEGRKLILGIYNELPNNTSWRFLDKRCAFPVPPNPFLTPCPGSISIANFQADTTLEFIGIKIGDVNNSAIANLTSDPDDRTQASVIVENQVLAAGETALVPVLASQTAAWLGFQFSLRFDGSQMQIEEVIPSTLEGMSADNFALLPGALNASWSTPIAADITSGTPLFILKIKALQPISLNEALFFAPEKIRPEAYDAAARQLGLGLLFSEKTGTPGAASLSELQPNPASDAAFFALHLPEANAVRLEIFDLAGKILWASTENLAAGTQRLELPVRNLGNAGAYAYRVTAGSQTWSGRFVKN